MLKAPEEDPAQAPSEIQTARIIRLSDRRRQHQLAAEKAPVHHAKKNENIS
jgi:hypothetical protein